MWHDPLHRKSSTMKDAAIASGEQLPAELYVELKDFYARHMKKRDSGFMGQWLGDFDDNAALSANVFDAPTLKGREVIRASVQTLNNWFTRQGIQRRHLLSMFAAAHCGDERIHARHYGLLLTTKASTDTELHSFSVASDLLQYRSGTWRVLSRHIERDDLKQGSRNQAEPDLFDRREETPMARKSVLAQPVEREEIYYSVEQFYARQMQVLDSGDAPRWAATFTNDGTFSSNGMQNAITGYDKLLAAAEKAVATLASEGITRRHLMSTLTIDGGDDTGVLTRCYVLVIDTNNGKTTLHMSTVMEDLLVFSEAGWLVQKRTVSRDGLA